MQRIEKDQYYFAISLAFLPLPIILCFTPGLFFILSFPAYLCSITLLSAIYIGWSKLSLNEGHWVFEETYSGPADFKGLPQAEWLYYPSAAFCLLSLYEALQALFGQSMILPGTGWVQIIVSGPFFLASWFLRRMAYLGLGLGATAAYFLVSAFFTPGILASSNVWLSFLLGMLILGGIDYFKRSLPILHQDDRSISGIKLGPLPLEDLVRNFSFLGLNLTFYLFFKGVFRIV